jgi:hypothetical protein
MTTWYSFQAMENCRTFQLAIGRGFFILSIHLAIIFYISYKGMIRLRSDEIELELRSPKFLKNQKIWRYFREINGP